MKRSTFLLTLLTMPFWKYGKPIVKKSEWLLELPILKAYIDTVKIEHYPPLSHSDLEDQTTLILE